MENIPLKSTKRIRVIIPAYCAGEELQLCVNRIESELSKFPDSEIVVVSYNSKLQVTNKSKTQVIVLYSPLNAGEARNLGAENCENCILVFVDADVIIETNSLRKLLHPLFQGTADATVGNYSIDMQHGKFFQNYKKLYINDAYSKKGFIENEFWTGYSAIQGNVFQAIEGFSESFCHKGGEDTEIGIRLTKNNYRIYAVAEACGIHLKHYNFISLLKNDFDKGTRTIVLSLRQKTKLKTNRHAKKSDQYAVLLAFFITCITVCSVFSPPLLASLPLLIIGYFFTRHVFFDKCLEVGTWFFIRSIFLAYTLDIVRGFSVVYGILKYLIGSKIKDEQSEKPAPHPVHV